MILTETQRSQRNARVLSRCRRGELADSSPVSGLPSGAFLRALFRYDRGLECYWHPIRQRWVLYRLTKKGATPASDVMAMEFRIEGPEGQYRAPGFWVIDSLQRADVCRLYGSSDPDRAWKKQLKEIEDHEDREEEKKREYGEQLGRDFANDAEKYAINKRKTFNVGTKPGKHTH